MSPEYKERTKHTMSQRKKSIQEAAQEQMYEKPPGSKHVSPGGQYECYETGEQFVESMTKKENRTNWAVLFDMVAELATWQAELAIKLTIWSVELAIWFASIVVTRVSQLLFHMAWPCGFFVGTLRAYLDGATGFDSDSDSDDV
eukprot:3864122-Amphidinium_carterae.1